MKTMAQMGEKAFLKGLLPQLTQAQSFVNGFGHDASIVDFGLDELIAFKIDRAPTPVALSRGWCDYRVWGRLAVAANLSDLLVAGAKPRAMMLSLVVPRDLSAASATDMVLGCQESCEQHGVAFVGGDTKEGVAIQVVGAAVGSVDKQYHLGRAQARTGDHLVVGGPLGGFAGALAMLDGPGVFPWPREKLMRTLTVPMARIEEGEYLRRSKLATAACDLSDGLADAMNTFCGAEVGLTIESSALPIHPFALEEASRRSVDPWAFAFGVGDWALACVVPHSAIETFLAGASSGLQFRDLGRFDSTGVRAIRIDGGRIVPMPSLINEHFRSRLEDDSRYVDSLLDSAAMP